jgi:hypothetical protein
MNRATEVSPARGITQAWLGWLVGWWHGAAAAGTPAGSSSLAATRAAFRLTRNRWRGVYLVRYGQGTTSGFADEINRLSNINANVQTTLVVARVRAAPKVAVARTGYPNGGFARLRLASFAGDLSL